MTGLEERLRKLQAQLATLRTQASPARGRLPRRTQEDLARLLLRPRAPALERGAALLRLDAALARRGGRPGLPARPRLDQRRRHQRAHLVPRVLEVPGLVARGPARDPEPALGVEPVARERGEARPRRGREPLDRVEIDRELDPRGPLVDPLAPGPPGARGAEGEGRRGDPDPVRHEDRRHADYNSRSWGRRSRSGGGSRPWRAARRRRTSTCAAARSSTSTRASSTRPASPWRGGASPTSARARTCWARAPRCSTPPAASSSRATSTRTSTWGTS